MAKRKIRNFVIISHVDHGKSTLADRFLELTGTVERRKMHEQFLDQMDLEREKGITIKMQPVRMVYHPDGDYPPSAASHPQAESEKQEAGSRPVQSDSEFILNLIDTPGHADFSYEVSRALAAVEGAVLLVDASQGVQAQTIAHVHMVQLQKLAIIPVVNKIDLPMADIEGTTEALQSLVECHAGDILKISGKTGAGVPEILAAIIKRIPAPRGARDGRADLARALIFDSHFDAFRGVIAHVRIFGQGFRRSEKILMMATGRTAEIMELGYFQPNLTPADALADGEIGYIATGLKDPEALRVGDTIIKSKIPRFPPSSAEGERNSISTTAALPGYREPQPMVFASIYPVDADEYEKLLDALKKVRLNDAALHFEPEASPALGRGFRLGFLGLLHMEIVGERIRREYGIKLVLVAPSVAYRILKPGGSEETIYTAAHFPHDLSRGAILEPWVRLEIITPQRFLGAVLNFVASGRGQYRDQRFVGADRLIVSVDLPLRDILVDFLEKLKNITEGYGSYSYELLEYRSGDLVRLDLLIAGEREEAIAEIVPRGEAYRIGRSRVQKLKQILPRQLFSVSIQAAAEGRIIARETLSALKKDVTGYLYGGDRTRKMKLWARQQRGKKRLREQGRVTLPPSVFLEILRH